MLHDGAGTSSVSRVQIGCVKAERNGTNVPLPHHDRRLALTCQTYCMDLPPVTQYTMSKPTITISCTKQNVSLPSAPSEQRPCSSADYDAGTRRVYAEGSPGRG